MTTLGMFSWISRQDPSERDQKRQGLVRVPSTSWSPVFLVALCPRFATAHGGIVNSLAQYEVHVAYYYERGACVAAISRAGGWPTTKDVPALENAVHPDPLYDALGMTQLRDDARRVMSASYPLKAPTCATASSEKKLIRGGSSGDRRQVFRAARKFLST